MGRSQCFLALIAISVGLVNSWDIAISTEDQLQLYNEATETNEKGTLTKDKDLKSTGITTLAYDAVHNMLLFLDNQSDNASIFSYDLVTKKTIPLVRRRTNEDIQGIAFDPVSAKLFWTDKKEKRIYWKSLQEGFKNEEYGNILFNFTDEQPRGIAVDSCRGYIYWTNINFGKATIERAKLDGSGREVVISSGLHMPMSIAVDQRSRKLYWADDKEGIFFSFERSNLDGSYLEVVMRGSDEQQPDALTISKDYFYWTDRIHSVYKFPKTTNIVGLKPELLFSLDETPFGLVANYTVADQTEGIEECAEFRKLSMSNSAINYTFGIRDDAGVFCLHGVKVPRKAECKCSKGYTGDRCEIPVCQNYCMQGECSLSSSGQPTCSCKDGFTGQRCEVDVCSGHCLHHGRCFPKNKKPVCICSEDYEGERCEREVVLPTRAPEAKAASKDDQEKEDTCNCTAVQNATNASKIARTENLVVTDGEFVESSCNDGWDPLRDPIIMVLGTLSGLLCVACAYLVTKVLQLKKRPRIKKRIIVAKNSSTPLTARPDQCEITIENCCNMNICETPCFEPRSTIRPTLLDAKPGREEKKNLISNMELPDDF